MLENIHCLHILPPCYLCNFLLSLSTTSALWTSFLSCSPRIYATHFSNQYSSHLFECSKMPWPYLKHISVSRCQKPGFCAYRAKLSRPSAPLTPSLYNLSVIITVVLAVACCFMPPCFFLLMESPRSTGKPAALH